MLVCKEINSTQYKQNDNSFAKKRFLLLRYDKLYIMNDEIEVPHGGDTLALLLLFIV